MGRTIPTATDLLHMEETAWKPFRKQLSKKDRPIFDRMFRGAHIFNYAMMMSIPQHPVAIQPILMSILLYHYEELNEIMKQLEDEISKTKECSGIR